MKIRMENEIWLYPETGTLDDLQVAIDGGGLKGEGLFIFIERDDARNRIKVSRRWFVEAV